MVKVSKYNSYKIISSSFYHLFDIFSKTCLGILKFWYVYNTW